MATGRYAVARTSRALSYLLLLTVAVSSCSDRGGSPGAGDRPGESGASSAAGGTHGSASGARSILFGRSDAPRPPGHTSGPARAGGTTVSETAADMVRQDYDSEGCLAEGCHASVRDMPNVHGPVAAGECLVCHELTGDPVDHEYRLKGGADVLCKPCHPSQPDKVVVHGPFQEFQCLECHDPHAGRTRALLANENDAQTCGKCHEYRSDDVVHGPYAVGECMVCHEPHQSDHRRLLVVEKGRLCLQCHTDVARFMETAAFVHGPAGTDCGLCHAPHVASQPGLLHQEAHSLCIVCHDALKERLAQDPYVHGAIGTGAGPSCVGCHTPHASDFRFLVRDVTGKLCLDCHNQELVDPVSGKRVANIAAVIRSSRFKHGPVREGDCQGCHRPHSSKHANLLSKAYPPEFYREYTDSNYALCFDCHERTLVLDERTTTLTMFRDGDRNLHYLHVNREKGRTCRACHEVHASNHPYHIRDSVPFGLGNWELPINFEKTETGGTCTPGCHKTASYNNQTTASRSVFSSGPQNH